MSSFKKKIDLLKRQALDKTTGQLVLKTLKSLSRREEIVGCLLVVTLLISAYFLFGSQSNIVAGTASEAAEKKIYVEGLIGHIKRLNPVYRELNPADRDISQLIFSGLSKYDPASKSFVEDIATHQLSTDKKKYTFTVKPNVKWHDDKPVTADDIVFTYSTVIQSPDFNNPIIKTNFQGITVKKIDDMTVEFNLKETNSFFFSNLTVGLLPYHLLQAVPVAELEKHEFNLKPVGTGPYKIKEAVKSKDEQSSVTLERFDNYYDKKPSLSLIKFVTFPDQENLIKDKTSVHGVAKISESNFIQNLREDPRFKLYKYTLPQYTAIFLNNNAKILQDTRVRLALSKSVDKDALLSQLENKRRLDTPIMELNQDEWLYRSNEQEAKGSLYDAGWTLAAESSPTRINKKGEELKLNLLIQSFPANPYLENETQKVAQFLVTSWEKIGVKITVEALEQKELQQKIRSRQYDLLLYGQSLGYNLDTYSYWHSSQANESGLNLSNYRSAKADSLIESIRQLFGDNDQDKATKLKRIQELATTIDKEIPAIFLYTPLYYFAADEKLKSVELSNLAFPSDRFNYITNWEFN